MAEKNFWFNYAFNYICTNCGFEIDDELDDVIIRKVPEGRKPLQYCPCCGVKLEDPTEEEEKEARKEYAKRISLEEKE